MDILEDTLEQALLSNNASTSNGTSDGDIFDADAEELEEVASSRIGVILHFFGRVKKNLLNADKALQNGIIYSSPHQLNIDSEFGEMILKCGKGPFVANILLIGTFILHKGIVSLIQAIVRQM